MALERGSTKPPLKKRRTAPRPSRDDVTPAKQKPRTYTDITNPSGRKTVAPPSTQAKLLAALQEHGRQPTGAEKKGLAEYIRGSQKTYTSRYGQQTRNKDSAGTEVGRGLMIASAGVPLGSATQQILNAAQHLHLSAPERTNILSTVPSGNTFYSPSERAKLAKQYKLGPNPTDADILRATVTPHHRGFFGDVVHNFLPDALMTPIGTFEGGVVAGQAAVAAGHGNFGPAKEIAAQQADIVRHPGTFIRQHPFQALIAGSGVARAAGAVGGTAGRAGLLGETAKTELKGAERTVTPAREGITKASGEYVNPPVTLGRYSGNLTEYGLQKAGNRLVETNPKYAARRLAKEAKRDQRTGSALLASDKNTALKPVVKGLRGLSRAEQKATLFAHGQGFKPSEYIADLERTLGEEQARVAKGGDAAIKQQNIKQIKGRIKEWTRIHAAVGDNLTPEMQDVLREAASASRESEQRMAALKGPGGEPVLPPEIATSRALRPGFQLRARAGDPEARALFDTEAEIRAQQHDLANLDESGVRKLDQNITSLRSEGQAKLDREVAAIDARLRRLRKVKGRISPGAKPKLRATPGEIRHLEDRRRTLLNTQVTSASLRRLEDRQATMPTAESLRGQLEQTRLERSQIETGLRGRTGPLTADEPIFFPHGERRSGGTVPSPRSALSRRSTNAAAMLRDRVSRENTGYNLQMGRAPTRPERFLESIGEVRDVEHALDHAARNRDRFAYDPTPGDIYGADDWVLVDVSKSGQRINPLAKPVGRDLTDALAEGDDVSLMQDLRSRFRDPHNPDAVWQPTGGVAPMRRGATARVPEGDWALFSRPVAEAQVARFEAGARIPALDKAAQLTKAWRWWVLLARPGWLTTNLVGNTVMAGLAGAGPVSVGRALQEKYRGVQPRTVENAGFFNQKLRPEGGSALGIRAAGANSRAIGSVTGGTLAMGKQLGQLFADANVAYENLMRRSVYLSKAVPDAKAAVYGKSVLNRFSAMNKHVMAELEKAKSLEEVAPKNVVIVNRFLGEFTGKNRSVTLDTLIPFHNWIGFIAGLTLKNLPLHHPGRALLVYRLGQLGIQAGNQMGLLAPGQLGGVPGNTNGYSLALGDPAPGFTRITGTQNLNPFATVSQLGAFDTRKSDQPQLGGLVQAANPFLQAAWKSTLGYDPATGMDLETTTGQPVKTTDLGTRGKVFANQILQMFPLAPLARGYEHSDESLPFGTKFPFVGSQFESPLPYNADPSRPQRDTNARILGYLSGLNVRDTDLQANQSTQIVKLIGRLKTERRNQLKAYYREHPNG